MFYVKIQWSISVLGENEVTPTEWRILRNACTTRFLLDCLLHSATVQLHHTHMQRMQTEVGGMGHFKYSSVQVRVVVPFVTLIPYWKKTSWILVTSALSVALKTHTHTHKHLTVSRGWHAVSVCVLQLNVLTGSVTLTVNWQLLIIIEITLWHFLLFSKC